MDSLINWKRKDYGALKKAVNNFNRELAKVENVNSKLLPEQKNYQEIKKHITTRNELNRIINSLHRASVEKFESFEKLSSGEYVTKYEYQETRKLKNRAIRNLTDELERIYNKKKETGNRYMGEERITEIQETISSLDETFESKESFNKMQKRLNYLGRTDYEMTRAKLFRENYYKGLESLKNFENYSVLKKKLDSIKNPIKFYEYVEKSPILADMLLWYKEENGTLTYGKFDSNEQAFDSALLDLKLIKQTE